ncbi:MAG: hypothetical protein JSR37_04235 [Verrucomicrobia bacterium]|nr:hypothetical protein [Verrucomicrobiota bacterium]MBS0636528.1 hypothetical protein [Verrucomicrobiota bacterium]
MNAVTSFIQVADSLRLYRDDDRYLHVNGTLISKVDSNLKKSSLKEITALVKSILENEFKDATPKEQQRFRHAFSCVIANYGKDPAYKEARRLLKTIESKKVRFLGDLNSKPKPKTPAKIRPLESLATDPNLDIELIIDTVYHNWFKRDDVNGKAVIAILRDALIEVDEAIKDDPSRDPIALCIDSKRRAIDTFESKKEHFDNESFATYYDLGWINLDSLNQLLQNLQPNVEQTLSVTFPKEGHEKLEEILTHPAVEAAINALFSH